MEQLQGSVEGVDEDGRLLVERKLERLSERLSYRQFDMQFER